MRIPYLRWWIAGLLVCGSVLNYLDRAALGFAGTQIKAELHLSETQYAAIISAFLAAYTLSYLFGAVLVDRLGTRRSLILTVGLWSTANMTHAPARASYRDDDQQLDQRERPPSHGPPLSREAGFSVTQRE